MSEPVFKHCGTCFGARRRGFNCPTCRNSHFDENETTWHLNLSKYHRDNLISLLTAIGYPSQRDTVEPFTAANTGDWVGELWLDLQYPQGKDKPDQPNATPSDLRNRVEMWLKYRVK